MAFYAGIDLGTTTSEIAHVSSGAAKCLEIGNSPKVPSVVQFNFATRTASRHGSDAENYRKGHVILYDSKRFLGRKPHGGDVDKIKQMGLPFPIVNDEHGNAVYRVINTWEPGGNYYNLSPGVVSAEILKFLATNYRQRNGIAANTEFKAVITIPANFQEPQRAATQQAAKDAGITVLRLVAEPTAAAVANLEPMRKNGDKIDGIHMVFDFGGGTHDVSIVQVEGKRYQVLATGGDTLLGGRDVDNLLLAFVKRGLRAQQFDFENSDNDSPEKRRKKEKYERELRKQIVTLKHELSQKPTVELGCDGIYDDWEGDNPVVTREDLEQEMKSAGMLERLMAPVKATMRERNLKPADISSVILTGGSSNILVVQAELRKMFGSKVNALGSFDYAVAMGAAYLADSMQDLDTGDIKDDDSLVLNDIIPASLGIETVGDIFSAILPKSSSLPSQKTKPYVTVDANQTSMLIKIFQGENPTATKNQLIGKFSFDGLPKLPAGQAAIDVTFALNHGGVLTVTVEDKANAQNKLSELVKVQRIGELSNEPLGTKLIKSGPTATAFDSLTKQVYDADFKGSQNPVFAERARTHRALRATGLFSFIHETRLDSITMADIEQKQAALQKYYQELDSRASVPRPLGVAPPERAGVAVSERAGVAVSAGRAGVAVSAGRLGVAPLPARSALPPGRYGTAN